MATRGRLGSSWVRAAVLSLAAVSAVAGCASAGGGAGAGGQSPAVGQAATKGSTSAASRSGSPLASVGRGWTLAEYSGATSFDKTPSKAGATTVYLVSPQGARTALYTWAATKDPAWRLVDWSGDKSRALFVSAKQNTVGQLDLATRKFTSFTLPAGTQAISYSRPGGTAILASQQRSSGDKILRYDRNGKLQKTLASGPQNAATVAVYSPDGTALAVNEARGVAEVTNSTGATRSLSTPAGATCQPVRWWNAGTILASCLAPGTAAPRLWLVPASGARPTALTAQRSNQGPDLGDIDAWPLPSGLYLQALSGCGVIYIAKQASDGSAATVHVPQTTGNDNQIITANGDRLLVRAETSCDSSSSLLWFTPASSAVQMLIKAPAGIQGVIAAVAYQPPAR
jgi:hypothetical protein